MKEASWKGELVDEAGGAGDNPHRKTPKEQDSRTGGESGLVQRSPLPWPWEGRSRAGPRAGRRAGLVAGSGSSSGLKTSIFSVQ